MSIASLVVKHLIARMGGEREREREKGKERKDEINYDQWLKSLESAFWLSPVNIGNGVKGLTEMGVKLYLFPLAICL